MRKFLLFALIGFLLASCATNYEVANFKQKTGAHKTIAVLPYKMVYTGNIPKKFTEADLQKINAAESKAFQRSLFNALLNRSGSGKRDIRIDIQDYEKTSRKLADAGITDEKAYDMYPEELCRILGVDAVVRARCEKQRFISDLASYGIDVGKDILDMVAVLAGVPQAAGIPVPADLQKTYNIKVECTLLNGADGGVLWKYAYDTQADWQYKPEEVIEAFNRRSAKHFPYRRK